MGGGLREHLEDKMWVKVRRTWKRKRGDGELVTGMQSQESGSHGWLLALLDTQVHQCVTQTWQEAVAASGPTLLKKTHTRIKTSKRHHLSFGELNITGGFFFHLSQKGLVNIFTKTQRALSNCGSLKPKSIWLPHLECASWAGTGKLHSHPAIKYVWKSVSSAHLWLHFSSLFSTQINAYILKIIASKLFLFYNCCGHNPLLHLAR